MTQLDANFTPPRLPTPAPAVRREPASLPLPPLPAEHPPIRLVAIDLDGTLLRTDKRLSLRAVEAVAEATRRGVHVVLASARPPRSVREIYGHLGLSTYQVNYNGALIHDMPRRRNVFHQPLPARLAQRIVKVARRIDPQVVISAEILDHWYTDRVDPTLAVASDRVAAPHALGPLESLLRVPVTKLMLLAPPERLAPVRDAVRAKFGRRIAIMVSDAHLIQIVHAEVDKAAALARVAEQYGIDRREVMAIGDAPNDVGMLRWAGLGVAVGNAWDVVRLAADIVVPTNDDDGVAHAIEQYVLRLR